MKLPQADWTGRADLATLVKALGAGTVRWVGGAVRDTLRHQAVEDIDAATVLEPAEVMERLRAHGIRAIPTGIDHGTVTAVLPGGHVEVTTLRHDVSTDGRRATVVFATDWRDDAARRDFTINALYADPETLEIHDYFGGLADLEQRRVRFIGDARQRIREDHLRILRYYRFQARFGSALDEEAEQACAELAPTLKGLSRERVAMELMKLLALPDPAPVVARMQTAGVLPVILPEAGAAGVAALAALVARERQEGVAVDPLRRMAALLPADPKTADGAAARLRLSSAQRKRLAIAAARNDLIQPVRAMAYRHGLDSALDIALLCDTPITPLAGWTIPAFPLKGGEIVARGVGAGPEVAKILQAVERRWILEEFPGRERVLQFLDDELPA